MNASLKSLVISWGLKYLKADDITCVFRVKMSTTYNEGKNSQIQTIYQKVSTTYLFLLAIESRMHSWSIVWLYLWGYLGVSVICRRYFFLHSLVSLLSVFASRWCILTASSIELGLCGQVFKDIVLLLCCKYYSYF